VQVAPKPQGGRPRAFAAETAAATGRAKSGINQAGARGEPETVPLNDE
jgi:hypothetical protein